jgi:D-alanyl-D-alanine carboxypeptidase (penicillin-binding protein 5/6)
LDYGFAQWSYFSPEAATLDPISVWGGKEKSVSITTDQGGFLLPKADSVGIVPEITVAENLTAPVEKGQIVGSIQYKKDGRVVYEKKLYTEKEVAALSFWDVFLSVLKTCFFGSAA